MKYIALVLLVSLLIPALAQNSHIDYSYALKAYNLSYYEEDDYSQTKMSPDSSYYRVFSGSSTLQIFHPTIAFQWKTKGHNFHEIELSNFMFNTMEAHSDFIEDSTQGSQALSGGVLQMVSLGLRYEYIWNFWKNKDSKLVPSVGFALNPYFRSSRFTPTVSTSFGTSMDRMGWRAFITPRLCIYLSDRVFLDINVPLDILDAFFRLTKDEAPWLPVDQRMETTFTIRAFPKVYSLRVGAGIML